MKQSTKIIIIMMMRMRMRMRMIIMGGGRQEM